MECSSVRNRFLGMVLTPHRVPISDYKYSYDTPHFAALGEVMDWVLEDTDALTRDLVREWLGIV